MMLDVKKAVLEAESRIRPYIFETQTLYAPAISKITNANIYLKCENLQYTGSFKVRGAFNKLLSLTQAEREKGIVTASSGNHGAAVAYGLNKLNLPGIIFLPENVSKAKVQNIENYCSQIKYYSTDCVQTELHALDYAKQHNMVYISPYNDPEVIGGQGTIALELLKQLKQIDAIFVPIGGGGLIAGIAGYIKSISPNTKIIGCMPENSPVMERSIQAGKIIEMDVLPTLSDATAGGIEPGAITFDLCQKYVDDYVLVSEQEIKNAMIMLLDTQHMLVEGAAGMTLACVLKSAKQFQNKNIAVILSGANISLDDLKSVL